MLIATTNPVPKLNKVLPGQRLAFFGPMCAGKTFAAKYLQQHYQYNVYSLASKLKSMMYELYGIESKDGKGREILQKLGDVCRSFDDDVFSKYTLRSIGLHHEKDKVVIDDLRLPREAHLLRANGFKIIEIACDETVRQDRVTTLYPSVPEHATSHETERSYQKIRKDYSIDCSETLKTISNVEGLIEWTKSL